MHYSIHRSSQSWRVTGRYDSTSDADEAKRLASPATSFNYALNGYRGFCALLVFLFHSGNAGVISTQALGVVPDFLWTSLRYGVELFFMISGYVILGSLKRHASVNQFLVDRVIRIFSAWVPALISVSLVCALFNAKMFTGVSFPEGMRLFFANLLLLPPFIPVPLVHQGSWSLSYEWVFYLAAAVGAVHQRRRVASGYDAPSRWAFGLWLALCACFVCLFPRSTFFATGVLVFVYAEWFEQRRQWLRLPLLSLLVFLCAWRATDIDDAALSMTYLDFLRDGRWLAALLAFLASLHMFASVVVRGSHELGFLRSRVFQFLGNVSYSFYLWHTLVMSAVKRVVTPYVVPYIGAGAGFLVFVLASGAIGLAISWASWRFFEVRLARSAQRALAGLRTVPSRSVS